MARSASTASTGTVYGLVDPRDGAVRYIGQTTRPLSQRLSGHVSGQVPARVRQWRAELRAVGVSPQIVPVRENVPVAGLDAAEREEITRVLAAGGILLNSVLTAAGRDLNERRLRAVQTAQLTTQWAGLAAEALAILGGPLPPGDLPAVPVPDVSWDYAARVCPDHEEQMRALLAPGHPGGTFDERFRTWKSWDDAREAADKALSVTAAAAWGDLRRAASPEFGENMEFALRVAARAHWDSRSDLSRTLGLIVWYLVAVVPWRELAALGGLPLGEEPFTAWAGQDPGTREALEFLASTGTLAKLAVRSGHYERVPAIGSGRLLGAVAAAYSSRPLPGPLHLEITTVLADLAGKHMLTRPMADLLTSLAPDALDKVFDEDVAADMDLGLSLPPGTSGRVLRELARRFGHHEVGPAVRRAATRSSQALPVAALPDWEGWSGSSVPAGRVTSASLVRAGLAKPEGRSAEEYLTWVRDLWVPDLHWLAER